MNTAISNGYDYWIERKITIETTQNLKISSQFWLDTLKIVHVILLGYIGGINIPFFV